MTLLEATDGDRSTYLDIADVIERYAPDATDDLREMWRRIAFSILISNTDDHLRNHGFLRTTTSGWSLSPAFDMNPDPRPGPKHLATAIESDPAASVDLLIGVADYFRLNEREARTVLRDVADATSNVAGGCEAVGARQRRDRHDDSRIRA